MRWFNFRLKESLYYCVRYMWFHIQLFLSSVLVFSWSASAIRLVVTLSRITIQCQTVFSYSTAIRSHYDIVQLYESSNERVFKAHHICASRMEEKRKTKLLSKSSTEKGRNLGAYNVRQCRSIALKLFQCRSLILQLRISSFKFSILKLFDIFFDIQYTNAFIDFLEY